MSDNSSGTNSWTFLTSEVKESGVEGVGVLAQGAMNTSGSAQLQAEQLGPGLTHGPDLPGSRAEKLLIPEPPQVAPLESGEDAPVLHAVALKVDPVPSSDPPIENLSSLTSDPGKCGLSTEHGEGHDLRDPDMETFSDSFAPTSPCPGSAPHPDGMTQDGEEVLQEDKESGLQRNLAEEESKLGFEALEEKENEGAGVRRRNISLLTPQHHRDEDEEEDMEEEEEEEELLRPSPREDGLGFSLNKCIFGALVLLGLGTIFFSGVLLDLDGAGEADVGEQKDPEVQKEWLNPEAPRETLAAVQPPEVLKTLAKDSEQIVKLQAQLQEQEEQLKAAQIQVEEGLKERTRREELEVENQRMKEELDRLPVKKLLGEDTQRMKTECEGAENDLQGLPAMEKALEFLRAKITELSQNTAPVPPSAQHEREAEANQGGKEPGNKKRQGKDREEKERRNEWKKGSVGKAEVGKPWTERDGEKRNGKKKEEREKEKAHQEEGKELRGKGEGKKEREGTRGKGQDDGQRWKDGGEKRKFKQDGSKGDGKDDAKRKKDKHGALDSRREEPKERKGSGDKVEEEGKRGSEQKDWKHGKRCKVRQAGGNEQKEWKGHGEGKKAWNRSKEQEGDDQRGAGRKDELKGHGKHDKAQKEKIGTAKKNHPKGNGEKKAWKDLEEKRWSGGEQDWSKDEGNEAWKEVVKTREEHQRGEKWSGKEKPPHGSSDIRQSHHSHSNHRYSQDHTHNNYWTRQRDRIHHYHGSMEGCTGVNECAHAEGLTPVPQSDFENLLLGYLTRVLGPEEQTSKKQEVNKLVGEFFTNGVFVHDQIPFGEFVEDVADILEDVAEDEGDEEMEDEMERFAREAMEKFALPEKRGNEKRKGVSG